MPRRRLILLFLVVLFLVFVTIKSDINKKEGYKYFLEGKIYYEQGLFIEASTEFEFARNYNYSNKEMLLLAGNSYMFQKRYDEAEKSFRELISLDKKNIHAMNQLAIVYMRKKKYDKAIDVLNEALFIKPEFTATLILRGRAFQLAGMFDEAFTSYDQAAKQENNELATKLADLAKETLKYEKIYHNPKSWLEGSKMPILKPLDSVFPVLSPGPYERKNGWYDKKPEIYLFSLSDRPVFYSFGKSEKLKVFGQPLKSSQGVNTMRAGIPPPYKQIENLPIMTINLKEIKIKVNLKKPFVAEIWPKPMSSEKAVDRIQVNIGITGKSIYGKLDKIIKVYRFGSIRPLKGTVNYDNRKNVLHFEPSKGFFDKGRYLVYISPKLKDLTEKKLSKAKLWSFSVTN